MKFIDKYNCILCGYNKYNKNGDNCMNHRENTENIKERLYEFV